MADRRPNIVLFMTDQQRGDCLGIDGHPVLQTPYLDHLAASGVRFRRAYTACPVCVPARRTLMTGQTPAHHGVVMNYDTALQGPTLPGELSKAGYQTHLVGKLHLWPKRKLYGFMSADWDDSPGTGGDYQRWLEEQGIRAPRPGFSHGANQNGWVSRPWHLEERLHFTNWCADKAMEFLDRRDPTVPFFLKVSFHQPHQPCTPPAAYYDRYMNMDLPAPPVGDWARVFDRPQIGQAVTSWRTALTPAQQKQYQAGYYGCVNHIDDQIGRVLDNLPRNTVILFVSDHGDMLGDHQWIRKRSAFEGSARIPFLANFPASMGIPTGQVRNEPVELMDVMPTLLDVAGAPIPDSVDGRSLLPLLRGQDTAWRDVLHGECSAVPETGSGQQYLTDGRMKYIWHPGEGREYYFDLENDPQEMRNLADDTGRAGELATWRDRLVRILAGRPEGFVRDRKLQKLPDQTPPCLPGFEKDAVPAWR